MALIRCSECSREISDKAAACPGCGAPVAVDAAHTLQVPATVGYDRNADTFSGTKALLVRLAIKAVQELEWKVNSADEAVGIVTFETGMSWGSWSGISCSLSVEEVAPYVLRVSGTGKQNTRGGQMIALNLGGEAQGKVTKAIERMKDLVLAEEARRNAPARGEPPPLARGPDGEAVAPASWRCPDCGKPAVPSRNRSSFICENMHSHPAPGA